MGGSGGGNQSSTTSNTASYPAEFKPLAKGAGAQILAAQKALPLANFANANPSQTAGLAPFQQAVANFSPYLLAPSWGLSTLQNLGQPINQLAGNAVSVGNQTDPYTRAMTALQSGGFGGGATSFPGGPMAPPPQLQLPGMTQTAPQSNVVGAPNSDFISQLLASLHMPQTATTPILNAPITGPVPKT